MSYVLGILTGLALAVAGALGWVRSAGRGMQATEQYPAPPRRGRVTR